MANCIVDDIRADNGQPSKLWQDLQKIALDQREALKLYLRAKNDPAFEGERDENGEPRIEDLLDRDDLGFTDRHRMTWGDGNYSLSKKNSEIINAFIEQLQNANDTLLSRLSDKISPEERKNIKTQLDRIQSQIQTLRKNKSAATLEAVAQEQLEQGRKLLEQDDLSFAQLLFGIQMMEAWHYDVSKEALGEKQRKEGNPFNDILSETGKEAETIQERFVNRSWHRALESIKDNSARDEVTMEDLKTLPDEDFVKSLVRQFFDISRIDHPVIQRIYKLMNGAKKRQAGLIRKVVRDLNEAAEGIEDQKALLQVDEDGTYTGGLVHPFSPKFFALRSNAIKKLNNAITNASGRTRAQMEQSRKGAIRQLRKLQDVVDIRFLIDGLDSPDGRSREEYIEELRDRMGTEEADQAVEEAENMWAEYQRRRRGHNDMIDSELADGTANKRDGETNAEYRKRKMAQWEKAKSPLEFIREFKEGKEVAVHNSGHKFVYQTAKPKYRSEQWEGLTQKQKDFARFLTSLYDELFQFLPDHMTDGLQQNFLPEVKKDVVEQLLENGFFAALKNMDEKMFNQMTGEELNTLFGEEESALQNTFQGLGDNTRIPTRFLGDGEEDLDVEDRSMDLVRVTEMFVAMAANYHYMTAVAPETQLLGRLVQEAAEGETGGTMFNMTILDNVEHNVNALLYGNYREDEGSENSFVTGSWAHPIQNFKDKRKARDLEEKAEALDEKREEGEINEEEYVNQRNKLEDQYAELRGKSSSFFQIVESSLGRFTMFKSLALNPRSGIANALFGFLSTSVHSASYQEFTPRELRQAFGIMLNLKQRRSGKVGSLMKNMNILYEIMEIQYGTDQKTQSTRHKWVNRIRKTPYSFMTSTENFIQGLSMVAHMINTKIENVKTVDGDTVTISAWEAFDDSGEWDTSKYERKEGWETIVGPEGESEFFNMADRVTQLNKRLHGNYDVLSPMGMKMTSLGRLLMMFKSWVPEGFAYRFEGESFDEQLGRTVKGSYTSIWDTGMQHGVQGLKDLGIAALRKDFEGENATTNIKEIDIRNARKVLAEMKAYAGLFILMLTLQSMIEDDDDDEAHEYFARYTINTLYRVRQDITFYLDPATATNIVNNPMPVMRTATDFRRAANSSLRALQEPDYRGQPMHNWAKTIPIVRQIPKTQWLGKNLFEER